MLALAQQISPSTFPVPNNPALCRTLDHEPHFAREGTDARREDDACSPALCRQSQKSLPGTSWSDSMPFTFNASDVNALQPAWKHFTLTRGCRHSPALRAPTQPDTLSETQPLPPICCPSSGSFHYFSPRIPAADSSKSHTAAITPPENAFTSRPHCLQQSRTPVAPFPNCSCSED